MQCDVGEGSRHHWPGSPTLSLPSPPHPPWPCTYCRRLQPGRPHLCGSAETRLHRWQACVAGQERQLRCGGSERRGCMAPGAGMGCSTCSQLTTAPIPPAVPQASSRCTRTTPTRTSRRRSSPECCRIPQCTSPPLPCPASAAAPAPSTYLLAPSSACGIAARASSCLITPVPSRQKGAVLHPCACPTLPAALLPLDLVAPCATPSILPPFIPLCSAYDSATAGRGGCDGLSQTVTLAWPHTSSLAPDSVWCIWICRHCLVTASLAPWPRQGQLLSWRMRRPAARSGP